LGDRLIFTEYVDVDYLISLYKYSFAFILLSIYEGFGRTPFEAVACGCKRIILSDIEVFHETFDGNATFLPLNDLKISEDFLRNENFVEVQTDFKIPFDVLEFNITKLLDNISN
ncbi:glycosyltransferase, partial [Phocaeicola sp.]|uniref:glycosyltransferase n=1 Tax=Phocaeicola sp. TaxID=2773926 RepID=UPI003AB3F25E